MTSSGVEGKRDSVVVTLLCGLSIAIGFLALAGAVIPFIGERIGLVLSFFAIAVGVVAMVIALGRNLRLVLPAVSLLFGAVPGARINWHQLRTVWVESAQICATPRFRPASFVGLIGGIAQASGYRETVGSNVCGQLGRRFTDHECEGRVGRIKCEP